MDDLVGRALGPRGQYRLSELLGRGGMGAVYRAEQVALKRQVAVKVVDPTLTRQEGFIERFEQEARIIARLEHAHILPVYDFGEEQGLFYLVMRLVAGGALKDRMPEGEVGRWTPAQALALARQMLPALDYAHREGVVHRDLKPGNILMQGDWAFLADFGVAKLVQGEQGLTGYGVVVGTPEYMAPEQVLGLPLDGRADLYAFAMVLYEALTGTLPFRADSPMAVALHQVQTALPPPRQFNPELPVAVEAVLQQALAKDREQRYPGGEELVAALEEALGETIARKAATPTTLPSETRLGPVSLPAADVADATMMGAGAAQAGHDTGAGGPTAGLGPTAQLRAEADERERAAQAERASAEAVAAEQAAREAQERQARERAEREAREQAEREERERAEREAAEAAALAERERQQRESAAREAVPRTAEERPREPVATTGGGIKPLWLAIGAVVLLVIVGGGVVGSGVLSPAKPTPAPTSAPAATQAVATAPAAPTAVVAAATEPAGGPTAPATAAVAAPGTPAGAAAPMVAPAAMAVPRGGAELVALADGSVLAIGGASGKDVQGSAEQYDPKTNTWSAAGTMTAGRIGHTATLLKDGRVLVAGGQASDRVYLNTAELYDPKTNAWSNAAKLATARTGHTATLLPDGTVLVVGGASGQGNVGTSELYDPAVDTWTLAGSLANERRDHAAAPLPDGGVLVMGGTGTSAPRSAERWDPKAREWHAAGSPTQGRVAPTATALPDGRVLVVGGYDAGGKTPVASAELYDPQGNAWSAGGQMASPRVGHVAVPLPDGQVLVAGGRDANGLLNAAERYDAVANRWAAASPMTTPRWQFAAVPLAGGRVLVVGGAPDVSDSGAGLASAELYDSATNTWAAGQ